MSITDGFKSFKLNSIRARLFLGFGVNLVLPIKSHSAAADMADAVVARKRDTLNVRTTEQSIRLDILNAVVNLRRGVVAAEDRLLRAYPRSNEAYEIVSQRWRKAHKEPEDQSDAAGWSKYNKEYEEALKGWIRDFPDNSFLHRYTWFYVVSDDDAVPEKERIAAMDTALKYAEEYEAPDFWTPMNAAQFLVEHGWEPERALGLLNRARAQLAKDRERNRQQEDCSDPPCIHGNRLSQWSQQRSGRRE